MEVKLTAVESRAQDAIFVAQCSLEGLRDRLPLCWPTPPGTPPSPKRSYRSDYVYLGWEDLQDPSAREHLSEFDLVLRLVDFSGLRPLLAQLLGWKSGRGWQPFDPLSTFLFLGWQTTNKWNRAEALRNLKKPRYADYARRFGYRDGIFPSEGGIRYFLTTVGQNSAADQTIVIADGEKPIELAVQKLNQLLAQSVALFQQAGLLSPEAWNEALICPDGMLHDAASRMRCFAVQESCYQPTSAEKPRPCPAKEKDHRGCDCDTQDCAQICRYATPRDPQARFVWYAGSNKPQDSPNQSTAPEQKKRKNGQGRYGYCSLPLILADSARRFSLILLDDFFPANERQENPATALLRQLHSFYPDLQVDAVAGDAAFGYEIFLHTVYDLHARRVVDLRTSKTDQEKTLWPIRGYDDKGRPICSFGYALTANGHDSDRQRHKWFCAQACRNDVAPAVSLPGVTYPPKECSYLDPDRPHGQIINVGKSFPDGSSRLARDVLFGSPAWKRIYHRARNAVEGRNSAFQKWDLKRMPVYGQERSKAITFMADIWCNLTTLARLVREATAATGG
jgi:hypothetical protein